MVTKVKLSVSQHPLDASNNTVQPGGEILPVGAGLSFNATTPLANTITFDDSVSGAISQTTNVFATLRKLAAGVLANIKFQVPIYIQATECGVFAGAGSPEGVVTANPGSLYLNTSGGASTSLYVKQAGVAATGWVGK